MEKIKKVVKMSDFFNSFQMLRYQQQAQYRTFTGGVMSIAVIITIIIAFANMILDTVNRITISYSHRSERMAQPSLTTLRNSVQGQFMFGVEVWGYNLSQQYRLFDVVYQQIQSTYGQNYTYTQLPLVQCTKQHWKMLPEVAQSYDRLNMNRWLCPEIGSELLLQGRYTSQTYNQISITLYPCNNDTDPNRPCAPIEDLKNYFVEQGQWNYFTLFSINTIINADQPQYLKYYLEDRSYIIFSDKLGAQYDMYLKGVSIQSDNSIWPFKSMTEQSTYNMDYSPILYPFAVDNTTSFATFFIMKDPTEEYYERQVQKIFVVFSFMGGLIGAIMAALFIMHSYTSFAFELALSLQVFKDKKTLNSHQVVKETHDSPWTLNFFQFLKYQIYSLIKNFKVKLQNPSYDYITECRKQIMEQLDIKNLVKRLVFIQFAMSFLFEDYQLNQLHRQKPTLPREIKNLRRKIQFQNGIDDGQRSDSQQLDEYISTKEKRQSIKIYQNSPVNYPQSNKQQMQVPYKESYKQTPQNFLQPFGNMFLYDEMAIKQKMRKRNMSKIIESASSGNIVSRRLLRFVRLNSESEANISKVDALDSGP